MNETRNDMSKSCEDILLKKSPDGRYALDILDNAEDCNGLRICKIKLENRLSRDIRILDFADVPYSRRKDLYWGICSLLFVFYAFDKPSLKEVLIIYDIRNGKYAKIGIGKGFNILNNAFPGLRKHIIKAKVKSNYPKLEWTESN